MSTGNVNQIIYNLCLLWCGLLIGVSFIATPAKFMVAELDIVTAIKVGRATFQVYHYVELAMASIIGIALFILRVKKIVWVYFCLVGLVLASQYLLIQPLVEQASDRLFAGVTSSSKSHAHLYYIFCDCLKAVLLLGFLPSMAFISTKAREK